MGVTVGEFVHLIPRNFWAHEWSHAFEGLVEGVNVWNTRYADAGRDPTGFILTVARRKVYDAYRVRAIPHPRKYVAPVTNRHGGSRVIFSMPLGSADDRDALPHPQRVDREVVDTFGSPWFLDDRDTIDFTIVRMLANRVRVACIAVAVRRSRWLVYSRIQRMQREYLDAIRARREP